MPITRYTKWTGSILDSLNLEDFLDELSQYFLQSGFPNNPWGDPEPDSRQSLAETIADKLVDLGYIPRKCVITGWRILNPKTRNNWMKSSARLSVA
jgi:hypothetical protein